MVCQIKCQAQKSLKRCRFGLLSINTGIVRYLTIACHQYATGMLGMLVGRHERVKFCGKHAGMDCIVR